VPFNIKADVLDYDRSVYRIDSKSRFKASIGGDDNSIIFYIKKIGGAWYSILGNTNIARTLAVKNGDKWQTVHYYNGKPNAIKPRELWIKGVQSFYWAVPHAKKAIIWVHGGPKANVSPRFNPYYHFLNSIGFNVLAVNYPGSTGRGNQFESKITLSSLSASIRDCVGFLRKNKIQTVVLWGASRGNTVVLYSLNKDLLVDGIIDEAGFDNAQLVALSSSLMIPYFSIRGKYDTYNPAIPVNFMYEGGHDMTREQDFILLTDAIKKFLLTSIPNKK
jgi:pimeloyl-ACP methyl ester carboxylesterase